MVMVFNSLYFLQKSRGVLAENQFPSVSLKKSLDTELGRPNHQVFLSFCWTAHLFRSLFVCLSPSLFH